MDRQKRAARRLMNANETLLLQAHCVNCCRTTNAAYKQQRWELEGESGGFGAAVAAAAGSNQTTALSPGSASHLKADRLLSWREGGGRARRSALIIPVRITSGGRNSEREVETGPSERATLLRGGEKKKKNTFLQTPDNDNTISRVCATKLRRRRLTVCRCRSCGRRSS